MEKNDISTLMDISHVLMTLSHVDYLSVFGKSVSYRVV